ncbi:MAG TPA: LptF/LptG family permease, partial [Phycisphaerales bacterium]|nr:LptF/LptG family permease [Phycisphaerales bacterium]
MLRLPLTLWMRTTVELWRLLLLSTGMLVAVISFAVTIGPLADGQLSPIDALRFMLFASVPMLAYALPFGAGFAATLVYHRMGHDNELTAA